MNAPIQLPDTFEGTQSSHRVSDLKVAIKDSISSVFEVEDFMEFVRKGNRHGLDMGKPKNSQNEPLWATFTEKAVKEFPWLSRYADHWPLGIYFNIYVWNRRGNVRSANWTVAKQAPKRQGSTPPRARTRHHPYASPETSPWSSTDSRRSHSEAIDSDSEDDIKHSSRPRARRNRHSSGRRNRRHRTSEVSKFRRSNSVESREAHHKADHRGSTSKGRAPTSYIQQSEDLPAASLHPSSGLTARGKIEPVRSEGSIRKLVWVLRDTYPEACFVCGVSPPIEPGDNAEFKASLTNSGDEDLLPVLASMGIFHDHHFALLLQLPSLDQEAFLNLSGLLTEFDILRLVEFFKQPSHLILLKAAGTAQATTTGAAGGPTSRAITFACRCEIPRLPEIIPRQLQIHLESLALEYLLRPAMLFGLRTDRDFYRVCKFDGDTLNSHIRPGLKGVKFTALQAALLRFAISMKSTAATG